MNSIVLILRILVVLLPVTQCNMIVFPCVFAEGDELISDVTHVSVCTASNYVSSCALAIGDV